jgi:hypothetical protein
MRHSLLVPACLLILAAGSAARAEFPGPDCCSTYPTFTCPPGYLGYPAPPRNLAIYSGWQDCGGAG